MQNPKPATKDELAAQLAAASTKDGIAAINPSGHLVRLPPRSVHLAASAERGIYLEGLKLGWRLATAEDRKAARAAEIDRDKAAARGTPSPKKSGA
jgi:hypothetical protein